MHKLLEKYPCVLLGNPSNLFYATGYKNADAKLLLTDNIRYYFTDKRYAEEAETISNVSVRDIRTFPQFLRQKNIKQLAVDGGLPLEEYNFLQENGIEKVDIIQDYIDKRRAVKTKEEIDAITYAQEITDKTFSDILLQFREGMTEKELDRKLRSTLYLNGADELAFDPIVAFGKNTSKPHAHSGETTLEKGMLVTLDFGAKKNGYCSDMTRTVAFGSIGSEEKEVYQLVLDAQKKALRTVCACMTGAECHDVCVNVFAEQGKETFFTHSLGHGLGIDIHEKPFLSPRGKDKIEENCITSIEPGLYFPEKFGVRIEDIVVFTKTGVINLTKSEKELIII